MLSPHEIVVETVSFFTRQREHLLGPGRKVIHGFVAHNLQFKMQSQSLFVQSGTGWWWRLGNRPADRLEPLAHHVRSQQVAFLSAQLLGMLLLQVRRLRQNEQLVY